MKQNAYMEKQLQKWEQNRKTTSYFYGLFNLASLHTDDHVVKSKTYDYRQ